MDGNEGNVIGGGVTEGWEDSFDKDKFGEAAAIDAWELKAGGTDGVGALGKGFDDGFERRSEVFVGDWKGDVVDGLVGVKGL